MSETARIVWTTDANGIEIGVRIVDVSDHRQVSILVPSMEIDRELSMPAAQQLIALLREGIAFQEITGSPTFGIDLDQLS
ncbi:hypothetical protein BH686_16795 [Rhodococcus erythropolis]|uniref:hypothetical protein n=1 Tax=Rhodococcus erythropolis TaxID=1833 RepID=UPI0009FCB94D|nr:hypothetical protein [Rhodococcus erythropolis]ORI22055.1 hypothetical protein BH686_16795 [Rhodococcus erythropolis]